MNSKLGLLLSALAVSLLSQSTTSAQYAVSEEYTPHGPLMIGFELDKNYGKFRLDFDQEVVADSFNISRFTLQASTTVSSDNDVFFMRDAVFNNLTEQGNTTSLLFYVSRDDFARLVLEPSIAAEQASTFAALGEQAVRSPFGRFSGGQNTSSAFAATAFVPDRSPVYVTDFEIDMESKEMTLNFSEPVNPDTLDFSGLALQSGANVFSSGTRVLLSSVGASVAGVQDLQRRVRLALGDHNYNLINAGAGLCTDIENCFASAETPFVQDVAGNPVSTEGFNENFGLPCTNYSRDTTPPTLLWWELNLGRGEVNIVFSEPVHMPFFNYSAVVICNNETIADSTIVMRVQWPLKYYFENTHFVNFTLLPEQVNFLKEMDHVATAMNDTFLVLEPNVVTDTARLANRYLGLDASPQAARQARKVHQDIRDPEVIYVVLNMQAWYLRLNFSEVVDVSSIDLREIALLSARGVDRDTEVLHLADPSSAERESPRIASLREAADDTCLHIDFSNETITKIKNMAYLGHSQETTFVALTYKFIKDLNENTVRTIYYSLAQQVDEFYPDMSAPRLVSWDLDLSRDTVVLMFSEPVNVSSFDFTAMVFSSDGLLTRATATVSPWRGSVVTNATVNGELFEVWVRLSYEDINEIKKKHSPRLCSSFQDCFLSLTAAFAVDTLSVSGAGQRIENRLEPYGPARSMRYSQDGVSPRLLRYSVDMLQGAISMVFSEPVRAATLNTTGISLHPTADPAEAAENSLRLSRFSFSSEGEDTETLTVILSRDDLLRIKMAAGLAVGSSVETVWMSLDSSTCTDIAGNGVNGQAASEYGVNTTVDGLALYRPHTLTPDTSRPVINAILWSSYDVYVYWDDVISLLSLQEVKFYISSFESVQVVSLDGVTLVSTMDDHVLHFNVFPIAQLFKSINKIGEGQENKNMYLQSSGAIRSTSGVPSAAVGRYSPIRDGNAVVSFRLNMGAGLLSFELAYAANYSSFLPSQLSLTRPASGLSVPFTGAQSWKVYSGKFVEMYITAADLQSIQTEGSLAEEADGLFLVVPAATMTERTSGRKLSRQFTVPCASLVPDTSSPAVSRVEADMGAGRMTVHFSEPILLSTVAVTDFYIVSARVDSPAQVVQLSQAELLTQADNSAGTVTSVSFNLETGAHPTDRDRLHLAGIGLSASTFNLYVAEGSIADTSTPTNYLRQSGYAEAVAVSTFTADKVRPQLISFVLDMQTRKLVLTFDEAVDPSSNKPSYYTIIQNPFDPTANSYRLTDSVTSASSFIGTTNVISIDLSDFDVDSMMFLYPNLATNKENSYLSVLPAAIRDLSPSVNGNPEIFYLFALSASTFYLDRTPPALLRFDFSLDEGLLTLYFNEVMKCSLTNASGILFQHAAFSGSSSLVYRLQNKWSTVLPCSSDFSKIITIKLGKIEIFSVKSKNLLMKSEFNSYLRFRTDTFFDVNENSASAIEDGRAVAVTSFTGDTTAPRMVGFSATRQGLLYLYFSEPVYRPSFNLTRIALQDDEDDRPFPYFESKAYRMMRLRDDEYHSYLARVDPFQMEYVIDMQRDYLNQVHHSYIFQMQKTTFLQYQTSLVTDMSGNYIIPMPRSNPINVGPAIVIWNLDLNLNVLTLAFTENVSTSFSPIGIKIQNDASDPNITVVLSGTNSNFRYVPAELEMYTYVEVALDFLDVMELRLSGLLDNYLSPHLYLACGVNLTEAVSPASLDDQPYDSTAVHTFDALPIGDFWPDTLGPSCLSYDLNLDSGHLIIYFSEPVDAGSLDVTKISLLSFDSGDILKLTGVNSIVLVGYTTIDILLTPSDLCYIKRAVRNAVLEYMLISEGAIVDSFGNPILSNDVNSLISIGTFVPDTSPPNVEFFYYDQNDHIMMLTFDEEIDLDSLFQIKVWILNASAAFSFEALQLTNYTVIRHDDVSPPNLPTIVALDLGLLRVDAARLDAMPYTAKDIDTTHIQLHEVRDIFGNQMPGTVSYPCIVFINDTTTPEIVSLDFSVSGASTDIVLYFSEVITLASFTCDDFSFSSAKDFSTGDVVPITDGDCTVTSVDDDRSVSVTVPTSLFSGTSIGAAASSTWAFVSSADPVSSDISGNALAPSTSAVRAGPHSTHFMVDMEQGLVTIVFSKDVDAAGVVVADGFGFYTIGAGKATQLSVGADAPQVNGYLQTAAGVDLVLELRLSPVDVNKLKSIVPLSGDVYMTVAEDSIFDADGVSIAPISRDDSFLALDLIPDTVRPQLVSAVLNMSTESILLEFDEPILLSSVAPARLVLQSLATSDADAVRLKGASSVRFGDDVGTVIVFEMVFEDAVAVKLHSSIGASVDATFLSFSIGFLTDTAGNGIVPILPDTAYKFDAISEDTVRPSLLKFDLDMNDHELTLFFSEPMRASAVDVTLITLQNKFHIVENHLINGTVYQLTGGVVSSDNSAQITISLSDADVLGIKNSWNLARLRTSSYLLIQPGAAEDMAGNAVIEISNGFAMLCTQFIEDFVRPNVTAVSLDFNTGVLQFTFSEPILLDEVDPTKVTLFRRSDYSVAEESDFYTLTSSTTVRKPFYYPLSEVVSLILSRSDLNNIRSRYPLGFSTSTTLVSASELFCEDTSNNAMWPISHWILDELAVDSTPPSLEFYSLDMSQTLPLITLTFSEAINPSTIRPKDCVVQSYPERRFGSFVNMGKAAVEVGVGALSSTLFIHVDFETANNMKLHRIGQFADSGYQVAKSGLLSWGREFFKDYGGNYIPPVYDRSIPGSANNPIVADEFLRDDLAPELYLWFFEDTADSIYMRFSEPVAVSRTYGVSVLIYDNSGISFGVYTLPDSVGLNYSTAFGSTVQIFNLGEDLLRALKTRSTTALTYLNVNVSSIEDMSAIPNDLALVEMRPEGGPVCDTPCPEGQYLSQQCTLTEDRVCAACSSCPHGEYQFAACSAFADTQCTACDVCQYGTYISTECAGEQNTVCSHCTQCLGLSYEMSECTAGEDTVCGTCEQCTFRDASTQIECSGTIYSQWFDTHCCFDSEGRELDSCSDKALEDMRIRVREARHHWTSPDTLPEIDLIKQPQYGFGRAF